MSRPLRIPIDDGVNDWDALVNDNLIELFDQPIPIHASASLTESNLQSTFPAASFDRCLVWVNHSVVGYTLYWSDGTSWIPLGRPREPQTNLTATTSQVRADVRVRYTGAGSVDYDFLAAADWAGRTVTIRNDAGATINLDPNGSETINGGGAGSPLVLAVGSTARVYSTGTALFADVSL
jgi:hypothetical protein